MNSFSNYTVINMNDALKTGNLEIIKNDISGFLSKDNFDVENFLKNNSVNFCKMKQAVTYLVYEKDEGLLVAYFTLALKIMEFPTDDLSKSMLKVLERNGNRTGNTIQVPGILLAQWSKNYSYENLIAGNMLMGFVLEEIRKAQHQIGGTFMFLECEAEKERLVSYYEKIGFSKVSNRLSNENKPLVQFIKKI